MGGRGARAAGIRAAGACGVAGRGRGTRGERTPDAGDPGLRRADRGRARADRAGLPARRGGEVPRSGRAPRGGRAEPGDRPRQHGGGGAAGPAGGSAGAPRAPRSRPPDGGGVDPGTRVRLPRKRCTGCARITRRPAAGSRRSCGTAGIAWMRPHLGRKRWTRGSTRLRRFAARDCGCSARARERSSTIRRVRVCPAPPTSANGCARPWTRWGRNCKVSARRRSWNSAGASPGRASKHAPIRSTCRHGGLCWLAPSHSGARRGLHRTRGRRSMRCSPAMPAWRPRSLPSGLSSKRAPCTWIGARRWTKGFAASTPRPRMRSRTGGNARRTFARPP